MKVTEIFGPALWLVVYDRDGEELVRVSAVDGAEGLSITNAVAFTVDLFRAHTIALEDANGIVLANGDPADVFPMSPAAVVDSMMLSIDFSSQIPVELVEERREKDVPSGRVVSKNPSMLQATASIRVHPTYVDRLDDLLREIKESLEHDSGGNITAESVTFRVRCVCGRPIR